MTAASKKVKSVKSIQEKFTAPCRVRTIKTPAKPGTIKRSVIRKAIKEILAEQHSF